MKTILAPVDFSSVTKRVVAEATALARSLDGRVVLLNVTQPVALVADYTAFLDNIAEVNDLAAKAAVRELTTLEEKLKANFERVSAIQLTGAPVSLILEQARSLPADYIVMGSHGHTAFYDLLVGGTASGVLKRASCPVVVVPPAAEKKVKAGKKAA
jgi:nucleotide-binding universal stress UspA family protein